jgi:outer membrane protein assembly factor BamB
MTLIELGEISPGAKPEPGGSGYDRRLVLRVGVALVAVLCVLTVTGSARPEPHDLRTVWTLPNGGDDFALAGDTMFVLARGAAGGKILTGYDIRGGTVLWSRQVAEQVSYVNLADHADRLLLPATFIDVSGEAADGTEFFAGDVSQDIIALDTRTGDEVWRRPGDVYTMTADTVLLSKWDPATSRTGNLTMVRLSDGAVIWRRDFSTVTRVATSGDIDPDRIVVVTADGRLEVLSWSDGRRLAAATVPWVPDPAPDGWYADITVTGDSVYVSRIESLRGTVTAYSIGGLRRRWELEIPPVGGPADCGPVVCLGGNGLSAYDPATGRLLWEAAGWTWAIPIAPGRLLVQTSEAQHNAVLDATTGRMVTEIGDAFALWDGSTTPVYVLRFTKRPTGFSSVTELDPRTGTSLLRGKVAAVTQDRCMLRGAYLACHDLNGALTVTDVG